MVAQSAVVMERVPWYSHCTGGSPRLINRELTVNPLEAIHTLAAPWCQCIDLSTAALVDHHQLTRGAVVLYTAVLTAVGLDLPRLLAHGSTLCESFRIAVADVPSILAITFMTLLVVPSFLWLARTWAVLTTSVLQPIISHLASHSSLSTHIGTRLCPFYVALARAFLVLMGASQVQVGAGGIGLVGGAALLLISWLPLVLLLRNKELQPALVKPVLLLVAAETLWIACQALSGWLALFPAAGLAACLYLAPSDPARLSTYQAQVGDIVEVHITGQLSDGTEFDTTYGSSPLVLALGQHLVLPPGQDRFQFLEKWIAEEVEGMYLGQQSTIATFNPGYGAGYYNPDLCWLQSPQEVAAKLGLSPLTRDVFQYPADKGGWLTTQVTRMGQTTLELDSNFALQGVILNWKLDLVGIVKQPPLVETEEEEEECNDEGEQRAD